MSEKELEAVGTAIESRRRNYLVVGHVRIKDLADEVGDLLERGWVCQGGITAAYETPKNAMWFYQAMIKR
ncbi:MAG TPA: hypothetical protein VEZ40_02065 [Pyrinomonadaceae bacterium]|nr:hypothetical protein [Pyrinomonadaceae bacterium]